MEKTNPVSLEIAWGIYLSLWTVAQELKREGEHCLATGNTACDEADALRENARKLREEGNQMIAVSDKRWTEADELEAKYARTRDEGYRYRGMGHAFDTTGSKIESRAEKRWDEAVKKAHGDMKYSWNIEDGKRSCTLENGERFDE
ncbi:MAG: hypothetical protein WCG79_03020 [Verrucomicrobiota bacterium]